MAYVAACFISRRGCVASPFFISSGTTSSTLDRWIVFLQTGHCDRLGSPRPLLRFSPAISALTRHSWQKTCPGKDINMSAENVVVAQGSMVCFGGVEKEKSAYHTKWPSDPWACPGR